MEHISTISLVKGPNGNAAINSLESILAVVRSGIVLQRSIFSSSQNFTSIPVEQNQRINTKHSPISSLYLKPLPHIWFPFASPSTQSPWSPSSSPPDLTITIAVNVPDAIIRHYPCRCIFFFLHIGFLNWDNSENVIIIIALLLTPSIPAKKGSPDLWASLLATTPSLTHPSGQQKQLLTSLFTIERERERELTANL